MISQEVNVEETPVSEVMTRKPMFVLSETLAVEALQKMVLGLWCLPLKLEKPHVFFLFIILSE